MNFWEGVLGMVRLRAAEPRPGVRKPPLLRSRRRTADHRLHRRGAPRRNGAHADRPGLRAPPRLRPLAGDLLPVVKRLDERGVGHSGVEDRASWTPSTSRTAGAADRAGVHRCEPPAGHTTSEVLLAAHRSVSPGGYDIAPPSRGRDRGARRGPPGFALGGPRADGPVAAHASRPRSMGPINPDLWLTRYRAAALRSSLSAT